MRASKYDHLRPTVDIASCTPTHEDRVLVRWINPPSASSVIQSPFESNKRDIGHQHGIVVATAAGNTGLTKINSKTGQMRYKPYCGAIKRTPCTVQPGDHVIYSRVPAQEFEEDGELYTFIYEEQHILAIVEAAA